MKEVNMELAIVHRLRAALVFLAFGVAGAKSFELLRVSVQPFVLRAAAFVLLAAGAGPEPLKQFAVLP